MMKKMGDLEHEDRMTFLLSTYNNFYFFRKRKWMDKYTQKLLDIAGSKREADTLAAKWVLWMVTMVKKKNLLGWKMSRDRNFYLHHPQKLRYGATIRMMDALQREGWVECYIGGVESWENGEAKVTYPSVVIITEKGWNSIESVPDAGWEYCKSVVEVKDREGGLVKMKKTDEFRSIENEVLSLNHHLCKFVVRYKGVDVAPVEYKRVFRDDFSLHGRFYAIGGGVQTIPSVLRREHLTINNETVIELDYEAMHPNMYYQKAASSHDYDKSLEQMLIDYQFKGPYNVDMGDLLRVNRYDVSNHREETGSSVYDPVRNLIKKILLILLNSDDFNKAQAAVITSWWEDKQLPKPFRQYVGVSQPEVFAPVIRRVMEHNHWIEEYFLRPNGGLLLMNQDSEVANQVVTAVMCEGCPILIYHDSFIVPTKAENLLRESMEKAWLNVLGGDSFCKITKK